MLTFERQTWNHMLEISLFANSEVATIFNSSVLLGQGLNLVQPTTVVRTLPLGHC